MNEVGSALTDLGAALRRDLSQDLDKAGVEWRQAEMKRIDTQISADRTTILGLKNSLDAKLAAQAAKLIADAQRQSYLNTASQIKQTLNNGLKSIGQSGSSGITSGSNSPSNPTPKGIKIA